MDQQILDLVAGLNPVPDESGLLAGEDELEAVRRLVKDRSIILQPTIETKDGRRVAAGASPTDDRYGSTAGADDLSARRRRRTWTAALTVGVAAALALLVAWVGGAFESADEVDVVDQPDPAVQLAADAQLAAEDYMAAFAEGDVDRLMALSAPVASTSRDRNVYEFNAAFAEAGFGTIPGPCEVTMSGEELATVECGQTHTDPVFAAVTTPDMIQPFLYTAEGLQWQSLVGGDVDAVARADRQFLEIEYPALYDAVCNGEGTDPGEVIVNQGLALTGECGELVAAHVSEIADWVTANQPEASEG